MGPLAVALVREELAGHGFTVRQPEARTSTLLARRGPRELEVHVRAARKRSGSPFWTKTSFDPQEDLFACAVVLDPGRPPDLYLISSLAWRSPDELLRELQNPRGKTPPEWRLNITRKNDKLLAKYPFSKVIRAVAPAGSS